MSRRPFLIAAGLTAVPFIITPILLVLDSDDGGTGYEDIIFLLAMPFVMAVYLGVGAIIAVLFQWRQYRSVARGVFLGLGVGLLMG